jgi:aldose 1-epimerase
MAPWPNRIRDGRFAWAGATHDVPCSPGKPWAIHGFVHMRPWQVVARTARVCEMTCDLPPAWPWQGRVWQRYELREGVLLMKLEVRSAREAFPAGCGWHPWFRRDLGGGTDVRVTVPAARRYVLQDQLPTGETVPPLGAYLLDGSPLSERRLDDCYAGLGGPITIDWGALKLTMTVEAPFTHVMVYTPPDAFCIEPQTCAPDAFNLAGAGSSTDGMGIARPGAAVALSSEWRWERAD